MLDTDIDPNAINIGTFALDHFRHHGDDCDGSCLSDAAMVVNALYDAGYAIVDTSEYDEDYE